MGEGWSTTYITFEKGARRGGHYHRETTQCDTVVSGKLLLWIDDIRMTLNPGESIIIKPGRLHTYEALEKGEMVSTCVGKRIGEDYAKDTFKKEHIIIRK